MHLYRNNLGQLRLAEWASGDVSEILGEYDNEQMALIAMQSQISEDIKECLERIAELQWQQVLVTRAIQNLYA